MAEVDGRLVVGVIPVAERLGGISPLGHRRRLPVILDDSMQGHDSVLVSAGAGASTSSSLPPTSPTWLNSPPSPPPDGG